MSDKEKDRIDIAYYLGVLNASGVDGMKDEMDRLDQLGKRPFEIINLSPDVRSKEEYISVIENCNTPEEVNQCEKLYFEERHGYSFYDKFLIEVHILKRKDELVNIP